MVKESPFTIVYQVGSDEPLTPSESIEAYDPAPLPAARTSKSTSAKRGSSGGAASSKKKTRARKKGAKLGALAGGILPGTSTDRYLGAVSAAAPDLVDGLSSLKPELRRTLLSSSFGIEPTQDVSEVIERLRPVVADLREGGETVTVGILDLDARIGRLPHVIEALNRAQNLFTFFDLQAPMPAGLLIPSDRFDSWARHRAGRKRFSKEERKEFSDNLMFNDFYKYAKVVRQTSGLDYLVGITQYMVAGEEDGVYYWNYFSTAHRHVILASAYDLREYAKLAGRPFEVAVTGVALAQLLAEMNKKLDFHDDRGCLFDMNLSRVSIVKALKKAQIEPDCLTKIEPKYRTAVQAMVAALRDYQRPAEPTSPPAKKKQQSKKHDDSYWLAQLNLLSEKLKKVSDK
jgi:hypothetical protein